MDPGFHLHRAQLFGGGAVGAAGPQIRLHLGPPLPKRLDPMAKKCLQKVYPGQRLMPQLLKVLTQGLQLAEVLPSRPTLPRKARE
jgi:hypothetical protein